MINEVNKTILTQEVSQNEINLPITNISGAYFLAENLKETQKITEIVPSSKITASQTADDFYEIVDLCRSCPNGWPSMAYAVKIGRHDVVKFLIDNEENINAQTPTTGVWRWGSEDLIRNSHDEPGYRPIELAIRQRDVEMIKILTSYHSENKADTHFQNIRYTDLQENLWKTGDYIGYNTRISTPYSEALATGNQEIIDLIIKSFDPKTHPLSEAIAIGDQNLILSVIKSSTDPVKLFNEHSLLPKNNREIIRCWIEQTSFLLNNEHLPISENIIDLYSRDQPMQTAIANSNSDEVTQLLAYCWIIEPTEFMSALEKGNKEIIKLLLNHIKNGHSSPFDPYNCLLENNLDDIVQEYLSEDALFALAKHNRVDLLKQVLTEYECSRKVEALVYAVEAGSLETITLLLSYDISPPDGLLLLAVYNPINNKIAVIELLLKTGIPKEIIKEASQIAYNSHSYEILEILNKAL